MAGRLRAFAGLGPADRALVAEAAILLLAVRLVLHRMSFPALRERLDRLAARPSRGGPVSAEQVAFAVEATAPAIPRASCLTQALVADVQLRRRGLPSEIRLGVRRDDAGRLRAHAWALSDGAVVVGGPLEQGYADLGTLSTAATG